jgi:uracil-DNA glycosylase
VAELRLVAADLRVIVCLGGFAWQAIWPPLGRVGFAPPRPRPAFGHGAEVRLTGARAPDSVLVIGCYHPSQQNTFTGRVTPAMLDAVFTRARAAAGPDALFRFGVRRILSPTPRRNAARRTRSATNVTRITARQMRRV